MAKKSAYLAQREADKKAFMNSVELVIKQYCIDTLLITMHEKDGWGYDKLMRLMEDWRLTRLEYQEAINPCDSNEADYKQEKIDRMMLQIIRGKQELIPFAERYPTLKKIKY